MQLPSKICLNMNTVKMRIRAMFLGRHCFPEGGNAILKLIEQLGVLEQTPPPPLLPTPIPNNGRNSAPRPPFLVRILTPGRTRRGESVPHDGQFLNVK